MKNKIFQKRTLSSLLAIAGISIVIIVVLVGVLESNSSIKTEAVAIKSVSSRIQADGQIVAQNQATLHFQTGGKIVYLPFKEGDIVNQGQTVASLDTSVISATFRQAQQDFTAAKAVVEKVYDETGRKTDESFDEKIKRTTAEATQNKAYDNMVKAQTDLNNASLTSPITGVLMHEDVTVPNQNITLATSFVIADPSHLVFRANVLENDIDFVSVGSTATISLGGNSGKQISGTVSKVYPDKITLPSSQKAYQVDIVSNEIEKLGVMGQPGTSLVQSNTQGAVQLVPTWTVLNHDSLWVLANGKAVLRHITVGKTHGDTTEILSGLESGDLVIISPEAIAAGIYQIL